MHVKPVNKGSIFKSVLSARLQGCVDLHLTHLQWSRANAIVTANLPVTSEKIRNWVYYAFHIVEATWAIDSKPNNLVALYVDSNHVLHKNYVNT